MRDNGMIEAFRGDGLEETTLSLTLSRRGREKKTQGREERI